MKVAMLGPFYPELKEGGVEHHVKYLADSLEKEGVEVERWSWKVQKDEAGIRKLNLLGIGKCFQETDADLAHFHSTATAFSYFSGLGRFEKHSVATIHAFFHPELESGIRMKLVGWGLSRPYSAALKRIKNNITVSSFAKKEAEERGVPVKKIIGSGIPLEELKQAKSSEDLGSDVVLVARLNAQKGVFDFIKAFSNSGVRATVVGYGENRMEEKVKGLCKQGGIRCLIRTKREETLSALKSSKVLAFPSRNETFGIVCLEAMALGKPVVVYKGAGGPLDFVKDKENGLVVDNSPESLKTGVTDLLADAKLLSALSKNAAKTAGEYDWSIVAEKVREFYEEVLG